MRYVCNEHALVELERQCGYVHIPFDVEWLSRADGAPVNPRVSSMSPIIDGLAPPIPAASLPSSSKSHRQVNGQPSSMPAPHTACIT